MGVCPITNVSELRRFFYFFQVARLLNRAVSRLGQTDKPHSNQLFRRRDNSTVGQLLSANRTWGLEEMIHPPPLGRKQQSHEDLKKKKKKKLKTMLEKSLTEERTLTVDVVPHF